MAQTRNPIDELDPFNSSVQPGQRVRIIIETTLLTVDPVGDVGGDDEGRVDYTFAPFKFLKDREIGYTLEVPSYEHRPEDDRYSIEILD